MHLWEDSHDTSINLAIQSCKVRLRSMAAELVTHSIRNIEHYEQRFRDFRGLNEIHDIPDIPGSSGIPAWRQDHEAVHQLEEVPGCQLQQEQPAKYCMKNAPKRLLRKLEADDKQLPYGWGLFFEESIVLPRFFKVHLIVVVVFLLIVLATYLLELARGNGYAVFGMGSFFASVVSIVITMILSLNKTLF